jgi:hypothetical protein
MKHTYILLGLFITLSSFAQEEKKDWRLYRPIKGDGPDSVMTKSIGDVPVRDKGKIRYIQDERIAVLDEYLKDNPLKLDGYRIQLALGSRGEVASARGKFSSRWNLSAYETYLPPNFRLRVGDFQTKFQAEKALRDLRTKFPSAFIVRDKIEVPAQYR